MSESFSKLSQEEKKGTEGLLRSSGRKEPREPGRDQRAGAKRYRSSRSPHAPRGGFTELPVDVAESASLNLDRDFYDLEDPGLLKRFAHRIKVGAKLVAGIWRRSSSRLSCSSMRSECFWTVRSLRSSTTGRWPMKPRISSFHGIESSVEGTPFITLDPEWHEEIEAEANYQRQLF